MTDQDNGLSRGVSIQSSPDDELLKITFALKGNFTRKMASELKIGKEIWLKLPYGDIFNRGHSTDDCVFIAGGTGITPFLSLFTNKIFQYYNNPKLYLGLRNKKYNIFDDEINLAKEINNNFTIKNIYQNKEGILNIRKIFESNRYASFFISGPPIMIKSFKNYILEKGVSDSKVIADDWT